jgi:hypothetical protein
MALNLENVDDKVFVQKLYDLLKTQQCEGYVKWLYLDLNDLLHIGVGINIDDKTPETLSRFPFQWKGWEGHLDDSRRERLQAELKAAVATVRSNRGLGWSTSEFESLTKLRLTDLGMKQVFDSHAKVAYTKLEEVFKDYDDFPADARLAMMVFAWAMWPKTTHGSKGTRVFWGKSNKEWPRYMTACNIKDWWSRRADGRTEQRDPITGARGPTAAKECHWTTTDKNGVKHPMSKYRYDAMVKMFRNAQAVQNKIKAHQIQNLRKVYYPININTGVAPLISPAAK